MKRLIVPALVALFALVVSCSPFTTAPTPTALPTATPAPAPTATPARTSTPASAVDLAPFKEMARADRCADIRNRMFLIDNKLVFWDSTGNCADGSYAQMLFGSTTDQMLCVFHDSIAGPVKNCRDHRYQDMFNLIIANLGRPDLGLGSQHSVQLVPF